MREKGQKRHGRIRPGDRLARRRPCRHLRRCRGDGPSRPGDVLEQRGGIPPGLHRRTDHRQFGGRPGHRRRNDPAPRRTAPGRTTAAEPPARHRSGSGVPGDGPLRRGFGNSRGRRAHAVDVRAAPRPPRRVRPRRTAAARKRDDAAGDRHVGGRSPRPTTDRTRRRQRGRGGGAADPPSGPDRGAGVHRAVRQTPGRTQGARLGRRHLSTRRRGGPDTRGGLGGIRLLPAVRLPGAARPGERGPDLYRLQPGHRDNCQGTHGGRCPALRRPRQRRAAGTGLRRRVARARRPARSHRAAPRGPPVGVSVAVRDRASPGRTYRHAPSSPVAQCLADGSAVLREVEPQEIGLGSPRNTFRRRSRSHSGRTH
jgi:hypothetical protein